MLIKNEISEAFSSLWISTGLQTHHITFGLPQESWLSIMFEKESTVSAATFVACRWSKHYCRLRTGGSACRTDPAYQGPRQSAWKSLFVFVIQRQKFQREPNVFTDFALSLMTRCPHVLFFQYTHRNEGRAPEPGLLSPVRRHRWAADWKRASGVLRQVARRSRKRGHNGNHDILSCVTSSCTGQKG